MLAAPWHPMNARGGDAAGPGHGQPSEGLIERSHERGLRVPPDRGQELGGNHGLRQAGAGDPRAAGRKAQLARAAAVALRQVKKRQPHMECGGNHCIKLAVGEGGPKGDRTFARLRMSTQRQPAGRLPFRSQNRCDRDGRRLAPSGGGGAGAGQQRLQQGVRGGLRLALGPGAGRLRGARSGRTSCEATASTEGGEATSVSSLSLPSGICVGTMQWGNTVIDRFFFGP
eukprot:CAMPEP_0175437706 /NCGR_PEP_ID=MMETSP0095-20121207/55619_1 /TAXON_ID=311494 /ORGANISM="Alexandrium monilatum, Strain CCMP3105" /LENGTH=227 /DNA_ID=CAMNT_0016737409 /DNA_START=85 /DNA_END=766 /DNA_ORIENTATION=+